MHNEITSYDHEHNIPFRLKKMEDLYHLSKGKPDKPHRHNYYTLIFVVSGTGLHFIDFKEYKIEKNTVTFLSLGQVHQVIHYDKPEGWVITFTEDFLIKNHIDKKFLNDINLFNDYSNNPPLDVGTELMLEFDALLKTLDYNLNSDSKYKYELAGSFTNILLIKSANICSLPVNNLSANSDSGVLLLERFKSLIEKEYSNKHKVSDYADALFVSPDYLNKVVKSLTGKNAKELIQNKLASEAKRSLVFTDMNSAEISHSLGFKNATNFNNFFKKCTGKNPSTIRNELRNN